MPSKLCRPKANSIIAGFPLLAGAGELLRRMAMPICCHFAALLWGCASRGRLRWRHLMSDIYAPLRTVEIGYRPGD